MLNDKGYSLLSEGQFCYNGKDRKTGVDADGCASHIKAIGTNAESGDPYLGFNVNAGGTCYGC